MSTHERLNIPEQPIITATNLSVAKKETELIRPIPNLEITRGEFTAISGPSGSGKSVLMRVLGGFDAPTTGTVEHWSADSLEQPAMTFGPVQQNLFQNVARLLQLETAADRRLSQHRSEFIGVISQVGHVRSNMPVGDYQRYFHDLRQTDVTQEDLDEINEILGMTGHMRKTTAELSGGQRQRVAIGYALAHHPELIIADEPDSSLDSETKEKVVDLMSYMRNEYGSTVIIASHDKALIESHADSVIHIKDGGLDIEYNHAA